MEQVFIMMKGDMMKRTLFLMFCAIFSSSLFAMGGCDLVITNKTDVSITEIRIRESDTGKEKTYSRFLEKDTSTTVKIKKKIYYDIFLTDTKEHQYGVERRRFQNDLNRLKISHFDFIPRDPRDTIRKILGA
jgi:hypothetical protein